jgi:hypothetical protein
MASFPGKHLVKEGNPIVWIANGTLVSYIALQDRIVEGKTK